MQCLNKFGPVKGFPFFIFFFFYAVLLAYLISCSDFSIFSFSIFSFCNFNHPLKLYILCNYCQKSYNSASMTSKTRLFCKEYRFFAHPYTFNLFDSWCSVANIVVQCSLDLNTLIAIFSPLFAHPCYFLIRLIIPFHLP